MPFTQDYLKLFSRMIYRIYEDNKEFMPALMFVVITWFLKVKFEHNAQEGRPLFNTKKLQLKHKNDKGILYSCSIATNLESSDVVSCILLGFSNISLILLIKKHCG